LRADTGSAIKPAAPHGGPSDVPNARLIDGAAVATRIRAEVAREAMALAARGVTPGLTVVLVGGDPASAAYVAAKEKACAEVGIRSETTRLSAAALQLDVLAVVQRLNEDSSVHGILVQMPLPRHIEPEAIIQCVRPEKDVDGFHPVNLGKLLAGSTDGFAPCTPAGIQRLLREYGVETRGADCVIVGRSNIVGKPLAALLMRQGSGADATVTVCHSRTRDLAAHTRRADILIVAAGRPRMITAEMVKAGAVVVDVGVNRVPDPQRKSGARLVGDVDFESVSRVASMITPVPGGVGPMTIAMLLTNTVRAASRLVTT
jgi:methylenetetrahydrofolate dehydrogenase (NADP+)/methenyltetrahydrofolate cyclohydrolase